MEETKKGEIIIYKATEGPELRVQMDGETVWLNRDQMAELFNKDLKTISEHVRNIYKENELSLAKTSLKQANAGKTSIGLNKPTTYYNLDMIISVGYRVNSKRGTQFRIWATQRLRDYLLQGYAVNKHRLDQLKQEHNSQLKELQQTVKLFQNVIEARRTEGYEKDFLNIIVDYANTWTVLHEYDEGKLGITGVSNKIAGNWITRKSKKPLLSLSSAWDRKRKSAICLARRSAVNWKLYGSIIRLMAARSCIRLWKKRPRTFYILPLKTIRLWTATSALAVCCFAVLIEK